MGFPRTVAEDSIKDSYRLEWTVEGLAAARSHVSLRSTTALTPPRGVIHYRGAASLRRSLQGFRKIQIANRSRMSVEPTMFALTNVGTGVLDGPFYTVRI